MNIFVLFSALICQSIFSIQAFCADLNEIDAFLQSPSFEDSFQAGDAGTVSMIDCIGSGAKCDEMKFSWVVSLGSDHGDSSAIIQTSTTSGPGQPESITKSRWLQANGNFLRFNLEFLESYGFQWKILSISPGKLKIIIGSQVKEVETLHVVVEAVNGAGAKTLIEYDICPQTHGPAQILNRLETRNFMGKTTSRRTVTSVNR